MNNGRYFFFIRRTVAILAILFGLLTIVVGGLTLLKFSDPGYIVFTPLLIFNTVMGFVYVGSGYMIWQDINSGISAAKTVFLINFAALILILIVYFIGGGVATESLKAMSLRTAVWLLFWGGLWWMRD